MFMFLLYQKIQTDLCTFNKKHTKGTTKIDNTKKAQASLTVNVRTPFIDRRYIIICGK